MQLIANDCAAGKHSIGSSMASLRRGDLSKAENIVFFARLLWDRVALGMLGGPPCESWSHSRTLDLGDPNQPRRGSASSGEETMPPAPTSGDDQVKGWLRGAEEQDA